MKYVLPLISVVLWIIVTRVVATDAKATGGAEAGSAELNSGKVAANAPAATGPKPIVLLLHTTDAVSKAPAVHAAGDPHPQHGQSRSHMPVSGPTHMVKTTHHVMLMDNRNHMSSKNWAPDSRTSATAPRGIIIAPPPSSSNLPAAVKPAAKKQADSGDHTQTAVASAPSAIRVSPFVYHTPTYNRLPNPINFNPFSMLSDNFQRSPTFLAPTYIQTGGTAGSYTTDIHGLKSLAARFLDSVDFHAISQRQEAIDRQREMARQREIIERHLEAAQLQSDFDKMDSMFGQQVATAAAALMHPSDENKVSQQTLEQQPALHQQIIQQVEPQQIASHHVEPSSQGPPSTNSNEDAARSVGLSKHQPESHGQQIQEQVDLSQREQGGAVSHEVSAGHPEQLAAQYQPSTIQDHHPYSHDDPQREARTYPEMEHQRDDYAYQQLPQYVQQSPQQRHYKAAQLHDGEYQHRVGRTGPIDQNPQTSGHSEPVFWPQRYHPGHQQHEVQYREKQLSQQQQRIQTQQPFYYQHKSDQLFEAHNPGQRGYPYSDHKGEFGQKRIPIREQVAASDIHHSVLKGKRRLSARLRLRERIPTTAATFWI